MASFVEIKVRVTPEKRTAIQEHAQAMGESATMFINRAIDNQISQDRNKSPQEAAEEGVSKFMVRAVETQATRDKSSLALGINPSTWGKLEKGG